MTRFFFDYATQGQSLYDYRGDEFRTPQAAIEFAGAIVEGLKNSLDQKWTGWRIEIRNAEGVKLSSLPII
jgi:hypothetical protein